jgi:hypothetical protein
MVLAQPPHRIGEDPAPVELVPGSLSEELLGPVAAYLRNAEEVLSSPGDDVDPLSPDNGTVPIGIRTDGVWVWNAAWEVFAGRHGVAPPAEFVEHAAACGFAPAAVDVDRLTRICDLLGL